MKKKFFTSGIGLMMVLVVAFAFLVHPAVSTANSTQAAVKTSAITPSYALGTAGEMLLSKVVTPKLRASAITDQETECMITEETDEVLAAGYNQNAIKRSLAAGTATYEDTINMVNATKWLKMSVKTSNLPEQRNFPLKTC